MEQTNSLIINRLNSLNKVTDLLDKINPPKSIEFDSMMSFIELDDKSSDAKEAKGLLTDYLVAVSSVIQTTDNEQYNAAVLNSNIIARADAFETMVRNRYNSLAPIVMKKNNKKKQHMIIAIFDILDNLDKAVKVTQKKLKGKKGEDGQICSDCKISMVLSINVGEYNCPQCKVKKTAYGIVPVDIYLDHTASCKTSSNYKRDENCEIWLNKLQGLETKVIPEELLEKLSKKAMEEDRLRIGKISCRNIRQWLKEPDIDNTGYNNHIPKIRFLLTGIAPERLTDKEAQETRNYFKPIMDEYNIIKSPNRKNSLYQPYVILKVLEQIVDRSTPELEKRFLRIVSNIHFQDRATIRADDEIMMKINVGLQFTTTDVDYYMSNIVE